MISFVVGVSEIGRNMGFFRFFFGLFAAICAWVRNYFRPYLSILACAIEVQHNNENPTTIRIDLDEGGPAKLGAPLQLHPMGVKDS